MIKLALIALEKSRDRRLVGGKAAALGDLKRSGFTVPDGFVVTTQATDVELNQAAGNILDWFDALNCHSVAVRSSSVSEDSAGATWAGQLETFLNVPKQKLIKRVFDCRASVDSPQALAYAKQKNLSSSPTAVLVQKMISSEISGVAFSVHPVTQNYQQVVVEAARGLGEALVSGEITPDNYVIHKPDGELVSQQLDASSSTGPQDRKTDAEPVLSPIQLKKVVDMVIALELHFGFPVDVEWAWAKQRLYILQCRPITALG